MHLDVSSSIYDSDRVDVHRTIYVFSETPVTMTLGDLTIFLTLDKAEELADKLQQLVQDIKITKKEVSA